MAFNNRQTSVSVNIQATTTPAVTDRSRQNYRTVSVGRNTSTQQSIFTNTQKVSFTANKKSNKATTRRNQVERSYKVVEPIPPSAVTNTPPPEVPTPTVVEEQSYVWVYTPKPPAPAAPKGPVEHYDAASTKDELVIDSLDNIASYMRDVSLSNLRPELLGSLDWIPGKSNLGGLTSVDKLIDVRWTMRQLLKENVEETIKVIQNENEAGGFDELLNSYTEYNDKYQLVVDDAYKIISVLEAAKGALDIKDNEESLAPVMSRLLGEKLPKVTSTDADLSIRSLFVNSLGFSEDGYDKFSNSKILNQIISDLRFSVLRHSPMLIGEDNFDRQDDNSSLKIDRQVVPRHRGYKLQPKHLRSSKFDPKKYSKYSSFLGSLPIDDEDKVKVLITMLSRELTISAGLGLMSGEALGDRFGAPDIMSVNNALGRPRDNILMDVPGDGSIADYVLINETNKTVTSRNRRTGRKFQRNVSGTDDRTILPFETRTFVDNRGRRAVPGSIAMVDNVIRYGKMFNTQPYASFARGFKDVTDDAVDYIEKLLNLEDEEYRLQPQSIFSSAIIGMKNTIDGLTSSYQRNEEQATITAILSLSRTDQELRHMLFRYLLELRDITDELATDESENLAQTRAIEEQIKAFAASARLSATDRQSAKMKILVLEEISRNLAVDAEKAKELLINSKNPLSHTAMKIARKTYELAEEFPAGVVPTSTRDIVKLGREAIYSNLMKAAHSISTSKNAIAIIINIIRTMEESAGELATRNNGDGTYLVEDSFVTRYNGWNEDIFFMMMFEVFVTLFSRHVESKLYRTNNVLYVLYDSSKNLELRESIEAVIEAALADSTITTSILAEEQTDEGESSDALSEGTYSQSAALKDLAGEGSNSSSFTDLQTFMTELEQETKFIHQMNASIQAVASSLSIAADQLEGFFDVDSEGGNLDLKKRLKDFKNHSLGSKFLQGLSSQQLLLLNAIHQKTKPRQDDASYIPADQAINAQEIASLRALLAEPKMGGRTGDNIRVLPVGIPAGLLATLHNPPYTIGSKDSTELQEHKNVIEINVYKRDLEYEDVIFKPKKYLYDLSLFLLPDAFDDVDVTVGTSTSTNYKVPTLEEAFNAARYRHFYALKNDDDEASEKRQQNEILDSGLYDFLGSGSAGKLLTNHLVDRLLQLYYGLLFGLEMGEHTFMYDDAWLDIFVDNDAKQLLQLAEANETTSWWVRNGSVPIGNLIVDATIEGETLQKVLTTEDASAWMKERTFSSYSQASKFWSDTENSRKYEAGLATQGGKDITHHNHFKGWNKDSRRWVFVNDGGVRSSKVHHGRRGHFHTHKSRRIASSSTNSVQRPRYHRASRTFRIPPLLNSTDLMSFRAVASSALFNSHGRLLKFMAPKLFDRVFMVPVDPDDFEIDVDATSENFDGGELLDKDFFSELTEDVQAEDGRIIKRLKSRRKGENYSSFNDFFVTISTPSVEST